MGSDTVAMADQVYIGLAVTSHNTTLGTTAKVDKLKITSSSSTNQPPSVSLTSPTAGTTFTAPGTIALTATASDPENRLSHVDFYAGTTLLSSDTTQPYSFSWSSVAAGTYSLTAEATDADGGKTTSTAVSVTVGGQTPSDAMPPTAPATLTATAASTTQINLTWAASTDNVGVNGYRIERCQGASCATFAQVGTSTTTAYSATGLTASTSYSFRVRATDAAGNLGAYSTVASATTQATSTAPTHVAFTSSSDHSTSLVTGYRLEIFAASANPSTATAIATSDLAKPTPGTNNEITVDRATFFSGLASGTYQATVSAYGPGGTSRGTPVTFTR
jgi:chitodextrinase